MMTVIANAKAVQPSSLVASSIETNSSRVPGLLWNSVWNMPGRFPGNFRAIRVNKLPRNPHYRGSLFTSHATKSVRRTLWWLRTNWKTAQRLFEWWIVNERRRGHRPATNEFFTTMWSDWGFCLIGWRVGQTWDTKIDCVCRKWCGIVGV